MEHINLGTPYAMLRDLDDIQPATPEAYMSWLLAQSTDKKYTVELQAVALAIYDAALKAGATQAIVIDAIKAFDAAQEQAFEKWINSR